MWNIDNESVESVFGQRKLLYSNVAKEWYQVWNTNYNMQWKP